MTGQELTEALEQAMGRELKLRPMRWLPLQLMRPVMPMLKGVFEMRYLWNLGHHLDCTKLAHLCPEFRATPVEVALRAAMAHKVEMAGSAAMAAT